MGGGAWPFLVGGVICLVDSVNERDLNLLNSHANLLYGAKWWLGADLREGVAAVDHLMSS